MSATIRESQSSPADFITLHDATRRYRLRDSTMSNAVLATRLKLVHFVSDHAGMPDCCFFLHGHIAAIRTHHDELAIFHLYQSVQSKMDEIGEPIE